MDISINEFKEIDKPVKLIYLWGMMGIGKTKSAKQLARKINWDHIDTDEQIIKNTGESIADIFHNQGEAKFREYERAVIEQLYSSERLIISTGGGLPCFMNNDQLMLNSGLTIWLNGNVQFIASRLRNSKNNRPLLNGINSKEKLIEELQVLYGRREPYYSKAHWTIDAIDLNVNDLVLKLRLIGV